MKLKIFPLIIILLVVFISLSVLFIAGPQIRQQKAAPTSPSTLDQTPTPTPSRRTPAGPDWKRYSHSEFGFSFQYPPEYQLKELSPTGQDSWTEIPTKLNLELFRETKTSSEPRLVISFKVLASEQKVVLLLEDLKTKKSAQAELVRNVYINGITMTEALWKLESEAQFSHRLEYYAILSTREPFVFSLNYNAPHPEEEILPKIIATWEFDKPPPENNC